MIKDIGECVSVVVSVYLCIVCVSLQASELTGAGEAGSLRKVHCCANSIREAICI